MPYNLKRVYNDLDENIIIKRKYNTRSRNKRQDEALSISQSAKEKLDFLALLRSKKRNKDECDENKNRIFNKWSLLSSDDEIDRDIFDNPQNSLVSSKDRSRSVSLASTSSESDECSSYASSCSYGKSKPYKKKFIKKKNRKSSMSDNAECKGSTNKNKSNKETKDSRKSNSTDDLEREESCGDDATNMSTSDKDNVESGLSENSEEEDSNGKQEENFSMKTKSKQKNKKKIDDESSFVLQASSQVNSSRLDSVSEEAKILKTDLYDSSVKKDRQKQHENIGPMHFTTHETVTADPHFTSNLTHDISKKCKDLMKDVKEDLKALSKLKNEKDVARISKHLLCIGSHINQVLIKYKDPERIREWRGNLWSYVSHYSKYNSFQLLKIYKNLIRIQETENDKKIHETDRYGNDYSGWNSYKR